MPAITAESFWDVLEKSRVLTPDQWDSVRASCGETEDPKAIARQLVKDGLLNKWQVLQLLNGRSALMLGKYKLLDQIDGDGNERLFLAEHEQLGRQVAIKTLSKRHSSQNPDAAREFLQSAAKLAALDHRNVIHVYDVESEDDRYFLVMEFVEGRNLKQIVEEDGALPLEKVAHYIGQAADGLAYVHERELIHGDIRPRNLLVDVHDEIKILNLRVKGLTAGRSSSSDSGLVVMAGEWDFVAPEVLDPSIELDHRCDLYSLGGLMFFLLTGHTPFAAKNEVELREKLAADELPSVLDDRPDVPEALAAICRRLMAKQPANRPAAANEVRQQLDEWLEQANAEAAKAAAAPATHAPAPAAKPVMPQIVINTKKDAKEAPGKTPPARNKPAAAVVENEHPAAMVAESSAATKVAPTKEIPPIKPRDSKDSKEFAVPLIRVGEPKKTPPPKPAAAKPEAAKPEAAKPEAAKPEAAKPEAAKPEAAKPEAAKAEPVKFEPAKTAPAKPDSVKIDIKVGGAKPEPAKPEPAKPEAAKAETPKIQAAKPAIAAAPQKKAAEKTSPAPAVAETAPVAAAPAEKKPVEKPAAAVEKRAAVEKPAAVEKTAVEKPSGETPPAEKKKPELKIGPPKPAAADAKKSTPDAPATPKPGPAAPAFAINTNPKHRKPADNKKSADAPKKADKKPTAKVAPAAAAAAGDEEDEAAVQPAAKGGISPMVWIIGGASALGIVLVVGAVILIVLMSGGGGDNEVVTNENGGAATEQGADTTPENPEAESDPAAVNAAESNPAESDPESDVVIPTVETPAAKPTTTPAESNPAQPKPIDPAKPAAEPTKPAAEPAKPADPAKPTESAKPEPEPAKPVEPAKPEAKPEPPKPAEPAKPTKKPFEGFPALAALPVLTEPTFTDPRELGTIHLPPGDLCFIKLRGGENACTGAQRFSMKNGNGGLAERDWDIFSADAENGPSQKIAGLKLAEDNRLLFQWEPTAKDLSIAGYLQNCAFSMSCGGESHVAILRQPQQAEALTLDLEKPAIKGDWKLELPPEAKFVKVQIANLSGAKFTVKPIATIDADGGSAIIEVADGGGLLSLQLATEMRRGLEITVKPMVKFNPDGKPEAYTKKKMQLFGQQANGNFLTLQNQIQIAENALKSPQVDAGQKRRIEEQMPGFKQRLSEAEGFVKQAQELENLMKSLSGSAKLQFRVFYDADSTEVEILKIGA